MPSVLFVLTSADKITVDIPTGWYLPEAAHPYYAIVPYASIEFASPKGPNPPVDERSVKDYADDEESTKFWNDPTVKEKLAKCRHLVDIEVHNYDAVFYVGGHGPVIDLASDELNRVISSRFWNEGKIVPAVCHGPAALAQTTDSNGKSVFAGRTATGFSNAEEDTMGEIRKKLPFLLENKIKELGGNYVKADAPWGEEVVVDGKLITGQNPASARGVGQAILKALGLP
ncbi:ThiJ/PfpI [Agrocybe pediades]|nr:ThiJ/PfpI [Agrocybe pediades]